MTIYADVLVGLNILITYIFLVCTRVVCKTATNKKSIALASFFGGFSSLVIFFDVPYQWLSFFVKLLTGAIIVLIAFLPRNIRKFFKTFSAFFIISVVFGGVMYFVEITINPENVMYYNGTVYFNMSLTYLVGSVLVIYGVFLLVECFFNKSASANVNCELKINFRGVCVTLPAIIDTGNNLTDGLTSRPVIVAEFSALAPLFDFNETEVFKSNNYEKIPDSLKKHVRLIPCGSVTGEGLLLSFLPEKIEVKTKNNLYDNNYCVISVVNKSLSDGSYKALINEKILLNGEEKRNEKHFV